MKNKIFNWIAEREELIFSLLTILGTVALTYFLLFKYIR